VSVMGFKKTLDNEYNKIKIIMVLT